MATYRMVQSAKYEMNCQACNRTAWTFRKRDAKQWAMRHIPCESTDSREPAPPPSP